MYVPFYFSFSIKQMLFTLLCLFSSFSQLVRPRNCSILFMELFTPFIDGWLLHRCSLGYLTSLLWVVLWIFSHYTHCSFGKVNRLPEEFKVQKFKIRFLFFFFNSLIHSLDNNYWVLETNIRTLVTMMCEITWVNEHGFPHREVVWVDEAWAHDVKWGSWGECFRKLSFYHLFDCTDTVLISFWQLDTSLGHTGRKNLNWEKAPTRLLCMQSLWWQFLD